MFDEISVRLRLVAKIMMICAWIMLGLIVLSGFIIAIDEGIAAFFIMGISGALLWLSFYVSALLLYAKAKSLDLLNAIKNNTEIKNQEISNN